MQTETIQSLLGLVYTAFSLHLPMRPPVLPGATKKLEIHRSFTRRLKKISSYTSWSHTYVNRFSIILPYTIYSFLLRLFVVIGQIPYSDLKDLSQNA